LAQQAMLLQPRMAAGVRAAHLRAIKAEILNSLNRPGLSLAGLAARHGVTPRHVQMLFESDATTFSRFVLDPRLVRAHRMLRDPRLAERTVSAIAYGDVSHFHRAFRRRYGETPSDVRTRTTLGLADRRTRPRRGTRPARLKGRTKSHERAKRNDGRWLDDAMGRQISGADVLATIAARAACDPKPKLPLSLP
jgi:AraC-like DNA-binding protein